MTNEERILQAEQLRQEREVLNRMLDKGFAFDVPVRNLRYLTRKKVRTFKIHKPYLDTMDRLADVYLQMRVNELALEENTRQEINILIKENSRLAAHAIAIAWLNNDFKIKLFGGLATWYFRKHLDSGKLHDVSSIIQLLGDYGNFINSIRLMTGIRRSTEPKADLIEEQQQETKPPTV